MAISIPDAGLRKAIPNTPRHWHNGDRLVSMEHGLVHVASLADSGRLNKRELIVSSAGIRAPRRRQGTAEVPAAHLWPASLHVFLKPGDPSYDARLDHLANGKSVALPLSQCWQSKENRGWLTNLSRETDLVKVSENKADSWKELHGERSLFSIYATLTNLRATGNPSQDITGIHSTFLSVFIPADVQIIESAISAVSAKIKGNADPSARKELEEILVHLENDRDYEKRIARGNDLPNGLELNSLLETGEILVEREANAKQQAQQSQ